MALSHIRQRERVSNITEPSTETEVACALWYDVTRQGLLREYVWRFAKARETLDRTGTPAFDWESAYKLPNDFIRLLSVNGSREIYQSQDYDLEGGDLLLNGTEATAKIRYIRDNTNVPEWDPLFKILMSYQLALKLSYRFTAQKGLVEELSKRIAEIEPKTITINAQERPPLRLQRSRFLAARGGGQYTGYSADGYFTGPVTDVGE